VVAESLWMGRLETDAAQQFEQHCRSCAECARISERERDVIRLIRAALAEESPELMTTCPPVIFATRWPQFTEEVESQIARNEFKAERLRIPASPDKQAKGLLTFRWFVY
jgi:hypothetical protein